MDYDVLILGGGIIGCAAAYELSKYSLNIALIEKDYDIADDVAIVNSAIVYDGVESEDSLVSKLEVMGNKMFDELSPKFNVPFKRSGGLIIAGSEKEEQILQNMYNKAIERGIHGIYLLESKDVYEMEPNLNIKVRKGLYSTNMGVVCPYDLAIAYGEVAFDNGVKFKLGEEVIDIQKISRGFRVETNKNKFTCKMVINTMSGYNIPSLDKEISQDNITYLNYFVLDKGYKGNFTNILFTADVDEEKIYTVPSIQGSTITAITSNENIDYNEALKRVSSLVSGINEENISSYYQSFYNRNPIFIDDSSIDKGYIKVLAKHYGQITMTPSVAKIICESVVSSMNCKLKKDFNDKRREFYRYKDLSKEELNKIIKLDGRYGKMVCQCQQITEGEIVDSIRRPLGARTIEGIKRRTGAMNGSCQGAYCFNKIVTILAKELNKNITEIVKDSKDSKIVLGRIKEFDGV